jgi:MerR family transcriptional regulator, redox-sensitive transcriptional activator SoxR
MAATPNELSIGALAKLTATAPSALRYYESVGLLPPPRRVNGRRRYPDTTVGILALVRLSQRAGFSLAEIRTLFHGFDAGTPPAARWRHLAERKVAELDATIAAAQRMRRTLRTEMRCNCTHLEDCARCLSTPPADRQRRMRRREGVGSAPVAANAPRGRTIS